MPRQDKFLSVLRSESGYISGQALAKQAGISRSAVWKQIRMLCRYGYTIESRRGLGYRLVSQTDLPVPWELERLLKTSFVGKQIIYREIVDSTQNLAISFANAPHYHGTVIIAEQQKNGRGRQVRKWLSPKGGIWLSIILKPEIPTARITVLPFAIALAVCDTMKASGLDVQLKWPNDVMIGGKKIAGILLDISAEADLVNYAVVGIGINANIDSKMIATRLGRDEITSMSDELGHSINRLNVTKLLLENFERYYLEMEKEGARIILPKWKTNSDMLGRKIIVIQKNNKLEGTAADINDDGSLLLMIGERRYDIAFGDISIRY